VSWTPSRISDLRTSDPKHIGPYALVARLGSGGMGVVYLGRHRKGKFVAIKSVHADLADDPMFLSRFRHEVEAASCIESPLVAQVLDSELEGERPYLVTEYVAGPTLADCIEQHGSLLEAQCLALAVLLAQALEDMHAQGVVHRDLKPSNVLLAERGPKLIDFGISRAMDATSVTRTGVTVGTPGWLSPEQARGEIAGPEADVFAWGLVMVYAATGRNPFGSGTTDEIVYRIVHSEPDLDGVPPTLIPMVSKALDKDPTKRPDATGLRGAGLAEGSDADRWSSLFHPASLDMRELDLDRMGARSRLGRILVAAVICLAVIGGAWAWTLLSTEPRSSPIVATPTRSPENSDIALEAWVGSIEHELRTLRLVRPRNLDCRVTQGVQDLIAARTRAIRRLKKLEAPTDESARATETLLQVQRLSRRVDRYILSGDPADCVSLSARKVTPAKTAFLRQYDSIRLDVGLDPTSFDSRGF